MRSCYSTKARFYNGDSTQEDLEWFFVPDTTPFLPVPSVINSLNWVPAAERVDHGDAGEVAGATRTYSTGKRDVTLMASTYCGTPTDWKGYGVRPTAPIPVDAMGNPACCGGPAGLYALLPILARTGTYASNIVPFGGGPLVIAAQVSSTGPFDMLSNYPVLNYGVPVQIDLFESMPNGSGTLDFLTDFQLLDYPGYSSQQCYSGLTTNDPSISPANQMVQQEHTWTQVGTGTGAHRTLRGMVLSDAVGEVLAYFDLWPPSGPQPQFAHDGDYMTIDWEFGCNADYP